MRYEVNIYHSVIVMFMNMKMFLSKYPVASCKTTEIFFSMNIFLWCEKRQQQSVFLGLSLINYLY